MTVFSLRFLNKEKTQVKKIYIYTFFKSGFFELIHCTYITQFDKNS